MLADKRRGRGDQRHTPAGPAARSCPSKVPEHPGWEWGSQKKGRGYRQRPHQAQGCVGRQLAVAQSPAGPPCMLGQGRKPGLSPWDGGKALSTTYRHAREDRVSPGRARALSWFALKRQKPLSEESKVGGPSGNQHLGDSPSSRDGEARTERICLL